MQSLEGPPFAGKWGGWPRTRLSGNDRLVHADAASQAQPKTIVGGINADPNREDEPDYIVKLIGKVITGSLETQKLIAALPPHGIS